MTARLEIVSSRRKSFQPSELPFTDELLCLVALRPLYIRKKLSDRDVDVALFFIASTMLPSTILHNENVQFDVENNPYRAKKVWPPDFSKLSPKYQFKLERRYRRRTKLAWARPRWTKFTKLAQYGLSICMIYSSAPYQS